MAAAQGLDDAARELNSAAIHLLRGLKAVDRRSGLTPARLSALSVLVFVGAMPVGRLAEIEDVASPTMTRIVDGLEELGLARRASHPVNGRIRMVEPTPRGTARMRRARDARVRAIVAALEASPTRGRTAIVRAAGALARLPARLAGPDR